MSSNLASSSEILLLSCMDTVIERASKLSSSETFSIGELLRLEVSSRFRSNP